MGETVFRILVADEADLLLLLQGSFLNRAECELVTADSTAETLERAAAEQPALVVIDADLDDSTGVDCCRRIKTDRRLGDLPVVLVAGKTQLEACRAAGADEVVCRPLTREGLSETLGKRLSLPARTSLRRPLSVKVDYVAGDRQGLARTKDISADGLFLESLEPFVVGEELRMTFTLLSGGLPTIRAAGTVVRAVSADPDSPVFPGVGVRFGPLSPRDRLEITAFAREAGRPRP